MPQIIRHDIKALQDIIDELSCQKILLVCDKSFDYLSFANYIRTFEDRYVAFSDFNPNPLTEDAEKGIDILRANNCDCIIAVGGGSSLDVAKYIKLKGDINLPLIAIPTTAGTGSESTQHIVVYQNGIKQSIASELVIPNYVILDASVLESLPPYQKFCTALDAFFQGVESYWSVRANEETRKISKACITLMSEYIESYFKNAKANKFDLVVARNIMEAANLSGQAINLTQTTAGHAMSYKLSSMFHIPHGHAVAICMYEIWNYSIDYVNKHRLDNVKKLMLEICGCAKYKSLEEFSEFLRRVIFEYAELKNPKSNDLENDLELLTAAVKPERLNNNPIHFTSEEINNIYRNILR